MAHDRRNDHWTHAGHEEHRHEHHGETVVPIIAEEAEIHTRQREGTAVRIQRKATSREEMLRIPITHEEVDVQRIPIGASVDGPIEPWRDGDTLVIPIMEQVPVVHMQWMVREEIRVTRHTTRREHQEKVRLQRQEAVIDRISADNSKHSGGNR
jgi:uncharacterized protein (TIGR02271 family)